MVRTIKLIIIGVFTVIGAFLLTRHQENTCCPLENEQIAAREESPDDERLEMAYNLEAIRWYHRLRAHPAETIPGAWREKALRQIEQNTLRQNVLQKNAGLQAIGWENIGPANIGGRTRAIAIDPSNSNIIYAGSVSGGIWKSTTAGTSWTPLTDNQPSLIISSIAIDPSNPNIIYAGTGEGYFNIDALRGAGVLKSTDGGASWIQLTSFSGTTSNYQYYYIYKIIVRSDNPSTLYAALLGGVFRSTNSGASWSKLQVGSRSAFCTDIVADPNNANILYASFGLFDRDGVYKTTNGGTSWTKTSTGFPVSGYGRTSIAIAKNNSQILYAVLSDSATNYTKAVLKTTNGGTSWTNVAIPHDASQFVNGSHLGGQGWYNNVIAVDPNNADIVYTGGINMFKSVNGGTSWTRISDGYSSPYMHVDHHAITFDPNNSSIIYFGNDGGVWKSTNGGTSFTDLSVNGYVTAQFYSGAIHPWLDLRIGGTQDNGTLKSNVSTTWNQVYSGDGGYTVIHAATPTIYFTEYVYLGIRKSTNSGSSFSLSMNGIPSDAQNPNNGTTDRCGFIAPFEADPNNANRLIGGTYRVYLTTNAAASWTPISGDLTGDGSGANQVGSAGSVITALAIAPSAANTMYAGTSGSGTVKARVAMTTNGTTWSNVSGALPDRAVATIAVDPANAQHVYVGLSGYNASTPSTPGHVFVNSNPGSSAWINISGDLPDIPVNKLLLDPENVNHMLAATDLGVFESNNGGTNWVRTGGLPNVSVADLDIRPLDGMVLAATHGRGMYMSGQPLAVRETGRGNLPAGFALQQNYPNPFNPVTTVPFTISTRSHVSLKVYDVTGREVATLVEKEMAPGTYDALFDGANRASGVYFCRLVARPVDGAGTGASPEVREMRKMILAR